MRAHISALPLNRWFDGQVDRYVHATAAVMQVTLRTQVKAAQVAPPNDDNET
jgi:hypothetical protein